MPKQTLRIENIEGGRALTTYGPKQKNAYDGAYGIEPDFRSNVSSKTGGALTPAAYAKFSANNLSDAVSVNWLTTTPKDSTSYLYGYASDGTFLRYTYSAPSYGSEIALTTPTSGAGNGMAYYNNYLYLATPTDIARYGPMDGTPSLTQTVWTGATLGSQTALSNTVYPTFTAGAVLKNPNHAMHVHKDGFLYFCDVISSTYATTSVRGKGVIHRISTKSDGTTEGISDNGSAYDVLELPFGWYPVDIESYGNDLAVLAMPATNLTSLTIQRGNSALFLWDTFASIPYKQITLPDPVASAIQNVNGSLHIWSGNTVQGTRVSVYEGGEGVRQIALLSDSMTPMAGAVDSLGDKSYFGGYVSYPTNGVLNQLACVYSIGSKLNELPRGSLHVPAATSLGNLAPVTTAVKMVLMDNLPRPTPVFAYADSSSSGILNFKTGNTQISNFRQRWEIGRPFSVISVRLALDQAVSSGVIITPTLLADNNSSSQTLTTLNNTNFPDKTTIAYKRPEITLTGSENLTLQLVWTGTVAASVIFPVEVDIDIFDVVKTA